MRIIKSELIVTTVRDMCIKANCHINSDIFDALNKSLETETSDIGKNVFKNLIEKAGYEVVTTRGDVKR